MTMFESDSRRTSFCIEMAFLWDVPRRMVERDSTRNRVLLGKGSDRVPAVQSLRPVAPPVRHRFQLRSECKSVCYLL
ncbi:hypothetical protein PHSY_007419 [Pseudozyma hubeiensis SY62]|uniref:Uncharacterized protein n=1 Tax=Pseudozyma hubeiensis (strain SY62) TaxID=1305764 RepID=R9PEP9_PSEHS|nr:hypothetical protein PHSY_007419 [Pseudozyma hubeiensis SY62]GAC99816.1 hypothetical protein PHSY_007419 [Pseudozyma hubeiensis SY62]